MPKDPSTKPTKVAGFARELLRQRMVQVWKDIGMRPQASYRLFGMPTVAFRKFFEPGVDIPAHMVILFMVTMRLTPSTLLKPVMARLEYVIDNWEEFSKIETGDIEL